MPAPGLGLTKVSADSRSYAPGTEGTANVEIIAGLDA
jgi:hypothetical protein